MKLPVPLVQPKSDDPTEVLRIFENGLAVHLITTARENFRTCRADEDLAAVVDRNRVERFDFLPVIEPSNEDTWRIVGIVEIAPFFEGVVPPVSVGAYSCPLSEQNLIGADASILSFVRDADRHRLRLVVAGRRISGLVSISDLQKLPVRAALFAIVTHLEMVMADAIRREFDGAEEWLERLSKGRQQKLLEEMGKSKADDTFVDSLLFTQFADKVMIIRASPLLKWNRSEFEAQFSDMQLLRNHLAHANDYATTPGSGQRVCRTVRLIDRWIGELAVWPQRERQ